MKTAPDVQRDRLTAIERAGDVAADGEPLWWWRCDCGCVVREAPTVVVDWAESRTACCRACLWGEDVSSGPVREEVERDDLAVWRARLARTCPGCGLKAIGDDGRCTVCGGQKSRDVAQDDLVVDVTRCAVEGAAEGSSGP